ncbi:MAG TPA: response regulator [Alphaproteobacteria bacterium]
MKKQKAAETRKVYDLSSLRVMVLEEFPFMADLMAEMLREFKVSAVLTTCKAEQAMEMLEQYNMYSPPRAHIDMLISDWIPPSGEGLELLKWARIHAVESIRYLPILFCTSYANQWRVVTVRDSGANEVLVKPVSAQKLAHRLTYIIDKPRPFVRSRHFLGPDRRRREDAYQGKERRVRTKVKVTHEQG